MQINSALRERKEKESPRESMKKMKVVKMRCLGGALMEETWTAYIFFGPAV